MIASPPKIDLLPEHLIDQIKAGEVIERPGNLIKEIMENAVDAGSTKIELTLKNNGLDLISLKDNGHGMRLQDLPLAFSRHATSKISRFEDLYRLHSFGFRGEALASIAAISKLQCISQTKDAQVASEIKIEGGETVYHGDRQTGTGVHGTELVIQDLFFNTPARLKFIQSQQAEKTFIKKIVYSFVLAHPEIEFHLKLEDADKDIYVARESSLERLQDIFPKAKGAILHSERFYENNEVNVFLVPDSFKGPVKIQNIYINNRYVLDKQLHRVMTNAIESVLGHAHFHYIAYFNLPADSIDVNVHPNKTIIKCLETSKMISLLTSTVKEIVKDKAPAPQHMPSMSQQTPMPSHESMNFFGSMDSTPKLQQERHEYNMEGFFSPHSLPQSTNEDFVWIGSYFLKRLNDSWVAISASKLLERFTKMKLTQEALTIPLLVSEPFPAKDVKKETLTTLLAAGVEIEYLGADTLVLRGIPDWMNGFPLKDVMSSLLHEKSFQFDISPQEWSTSTWEDMLSAFSLEELVREKVAVDLIQLLKEKLK